jgi:preprotein translocase subunit SecF
MAIFSIIKPNTNIPFIPNHKPILISLIFLAIFSVVMILLPFDGTNPNWGTSFQGGTSINIHFEKPVATEEVRKAFVEDSRFESISVQSVGSEELSSYVVRTRTTTTLSCTKLADVQIALNAAIEAQSGGNLTIGQWPSCDSSTDEGIRGDFFVTLVPPEGKAAPETPISAENIVAILKQADLESAVTYDAKTQRYLVSPTGIQKDVQELLSRVFGEKFKNGIDGITMVGADVGEKFRTDAIVSILLALGLMLLYIGIRFDTRYAPSAVISLTVTTLITFGFVVLMQLEITLEVVAAFLSLVGYGINDTIVTFDRVRENVALAEPDKKFDGIVNKAINECLTRTIITSLTTLAAIVPMAFIATGTTRDFAIIMSFGIIVATFNSMFVSCPFLIYFDGWFKNMQKRSEARKAVEDIPAEI